jgi:hypothetical protein
VERQPRHRPSTSGVSGLVDLFFFATQGLLASSNIKTLRSFTRPFAKNHLTAKTLSTEPVIVVGVLKKEMAAWRDRIRALINEMPTATEDQIGWQIVREISVKAARLLEPIFG